MTLKIDIFTPITSIEETAEKSNEYIKYIDNLISKDKSYDMTGEEMRSVSPSMFYTISDRLIKKQAENIKRYVLNGNTIKIGNVTFTS